MVSHDSNHIGLLLSSIHGGDITAIDLDYAYLNVQCTEKMWFVGADECRENKSRFLLIVRSLYGLKSSGFLWISALEAALWEIWLKTMMADPKICIRAEIRPDGYDYYEMLLVDFDDIMIVYNFGDDVARQIDNFYKINEGSQGLPTRYLGEDTEKVYTKDGHGIWTTSSRSYITNAIETVDGFLLEDGKCYVFKYNDRNPFPSYYRPELDVTEELDPELLSWYLQLVGIFRWSV